jgi:hypothetical protein
MLLAETGLPPGVDIDRGSLAQAMNASERDIDEYNSSPDRLIFTSGPAPSARSSRLTSELRFGPKALAAPSILYDYFNPEAHAVVEPVLFNVRQTSVCK